MTEELSKILVNIAASFPYEAAVDLPSYVCLCVLQLLCCMQSRTIYPIELAFNDKWYEN